MKLKLLSLLVGIVFIAGCATQGYVEVSTPVYYYDPIYIGPPPWHYGPGPYYHHHSYYSRHYIVPPPLPPLILPPPPLPPLHRPMPGPIIPPHNRIIPNRQAPGPMIPSRQAPSRPLRTP